MHHDANAPLSIVFRLALPHGACVGVAVPEVGGALPALADAERALLERFSPARRATWVAGRIALRAALADAGVAVPGPILARPDGAPALPPGIAGSISHKHDLAVGLAARSDGGSSVGIDLETDVLASDSNDELPAPPLSGAPAARVPFPSRTPIDISRRVLTPAELAVIAHLRGAARAREVRLRFSAKEALYKALSPLVARRSMSFQEATFAALFADGSATLSLSLAAGEGPFDVEARWTTVTDATGRAFILTTARASMAGPRAPDSRSA
jgi:4'-phosphopantetheinyl transferase EntD